MKHTMLATARLRFLFIPAKMWKHAGRTGISYSGNYAEKGLFDRLMGRLRAARAVWRKFCAGGSSGAQVMWMPCRVFRSWLCIEFYSPDANSSLCGGWRQSSVLRREETVAENLTGLR